MVLLDTNVLSEFMRPVPSATVVDWLDHQISDQVWVSAISRAEIELGVTLMPDGQRKQGLRLAAQAMFFQDFAGHCLPFDEAAASLYADVVARRMGVDRPISVEDAQIAAIALAHRLSLATRNTRDFECIDGLAVVNPWLCGP